MFVDGIGHSILERGDLILKIGNISTGGINLSLHGLQHRELFIRSVHPDDHCFHPFLFSQDIFADHFELGILLVLTSLEHIGLFLFDLESLVTDAAREQ